MARIKVLMVGSHSSVNGGITTVINQIKNYEWRDIKLDFIPTYIQKNGAIKILFFCLSYVRIVLYLLLKKPDIVYMHMSFKGSYYRKRAIYRLSKTFGVKVVVHLHGSEFEKWYNESSNKAQKKIKLFLSDVDTIIVLGNKWERVIKSIQPQAKIVVLNNSVSIPSKTIGWNASKRRILYLGVLVKRKGVHDLLRALQKLLKEDENSEIVLTIAGSGSEETRLKNYVIKNGLSSCVEFVGWADDKKKKELLLSSQILILPSYNEGLPMAILEAMSYGIPIISTDVGDISCAVKNGINGYLVNPGDIQSMASSISKIAFNRKKFETMSASSRKIAEEYFSDTLYFKKLRCILFDVAKSRIEV